jgi:type IV secretion system protein VirD4
MDLSEVRMNAFFGDEIYYDLDERNYIMESLKEPEEEPEQDVREA